MQLKNLLLEQFDHRPTPQQEEAFSKLSEFLATFRPESTFVLKGYAGTGKTSIVSAIVRSVSRLRKHAVLLAPTGRAAKVMTFYS